MATACANIDDQVLTFSGVLYDDGPAIGAHWARALVQRGVVNMQGLIAAYMSEGEWRLLTVALAGLGVPEAAEDTLAANLGKAIEAIRVPGEVTNAAKRGDDAAVVAWLAGGARCHVDMVVEYAGYTLLLVAAAFGHERLVDVLLRRGANINYLTDEGTALILATQNHHPAVVRLLLRAGADPSLRDCDDLFTAMQHAECEGGDEACAKALREHLAALKSDPNSGWLPDHVAEAAYRAEATIIHGWLDGGGRIDATMIHDGTTLNITLLMIAATAGHALLVEVLLRRGAKVDQQTTDKDNGFTALHMAARKGRSDAVLALLRNGAEVDKRAEPIIEPRYSRPRRCTTALELAVHEGDFGFLLEHSAEVNLRVVDILLEHGADVNLMGSYGHSALANAAARGHKPLVEKLLGHGAEVNLCGDRETPLTLAARRNRPAIVLALLRAGAELAARNYDGKTALQLAKQEGHAECVEAFRLHLQEVTSRREAGGEGSVTSGGASSSAAITTGDGQIPPEIKLAALAGDDEAVIAWLDTHTCVRMIDVTFSHGPVDDSTLLLLAACGGHERLVDRLLERGAEMEQRDSHGYTALKLAASEGHGRVVETLLQHGAATDCQDALNLARANGHVECVRVLEQHIAREVAGAESEAARHAEALLAEEEAEKERAERAKEVKKAKKKKKKGRGGGSGATGPSRQPGVAAQVEDAEDAGATGAVELAEEAELLATALEGSAKLDDEAEEQQAPASQAGEAARAQAEPAQDPAAAISLADAGFDTGRPAVPESTLGGETTCIVCFTRPKTHVAVPCGHLCACDNCSARMEQCPICRDAVPVWLDSSRIREA